MSDLPLKHEQGLIPGVRDFYLVLTLPLIAYWSTGTFYYLIEKSGQFEQYRIHEPEELRKRNKVTLREVFRSVVSQQVIQTLFAIFIDYVLSQTSSNEPVALLSQKQETLYLRNNLRRIAAVLGIDLRGLGLKVDASLSNIDGLNVSGSEMVFATIMYWIGVPIVQFVGAIVIADFWQYMWHRIFHEVRFLYKHVHSYHHRIYVPYAYGALYNTLLEAFIVDTIGTTLTFYLTGFSERQAMLFATLSLVKAVHDHSGYQLPYNPLEMISKNNTAYHDIHHQSWGFKYNYSQVYLTLWDDLLGTTMPPEIAAKKYAAAEARLKQKAS